MLKKLIDSPWLYFGLAALLALYGASLFVDWSGPPRPKGTVEDIAALKDRDDLNVVFVLIDTLRSDRMSSYGYERETSPYMDYMASRGIRFEDVVAQSTWTKASMASLWTGNNPQRAGVLRFAHALSDEAPLPAERFKEAGYKTAGFIRNGWVEANFGFGRGFDTYMMPFPVHPSQRGQVFNPSAPDRFQNDEDLTDVAMEYMSANPKDPFFLYIHYMDLHQYVYEQQSALFGSSFSDAYDNALHWTDRNIGGLVRKAEELGMADRTVFVIASDHGEAFREHGIEGHARDLHTEAIRVPWIIGLPFDLEEPVVVKGRVANIDMWPTILEMLGMPELPNVDGRSAMPAILAGGSDPNPDPERVFFGQLDRHWGKTQEDPKPLVAANRPPYQLFYEPLSEDMNVQLFDQSNDPGEKRNIAADNPDVVEELRAVGDAYVNQSGWEPEEIELDDMRKAQLKALGYVDE